MNQLAADPSSPTSIRRIESFATIDSTSSELKRRVDDGVDVDGLVITAETQTAGRGRHGRTWVDQPGGSLLFSIGWHAPVDASRLSGLSLAAGVAIADALQLEGVANVELKWPNDLLLRHCKLGGILIETVNARAQSTVVIIGVGINVDLDASMREQVSGAVIGLSDSGWDGDRQALLTTILTGLDRLLARFPDEGFAPYRAAWIGRHALQQRNVTIWRSGREIAAGKAIDVDQDGALMLQTSAGVRRFTSGESTLRAT